jgi:hypothetical protein
MNSREKERLALRDARKTAMKSQYARRRRERRVAAKPRLKLATENGFYVLTAPNSLNVATRFGVPILALLILLAVFRSEWIPVVAGFILIVFVWMIFLEKWHPQAWPATITARPDGTFETRGGMRRSVLDDGMIRDATIEAWHGKETALVSWRLKTDHGGTEFQKFGDADVRTLRTFAEKIGARFSIDRPEQAESEGFEERGGWPKFLLTTAAFVGGLAALLWYIPKHASSEEDISFTNRSLTGTFRSTNKDLGQWTLQPTACLDGHERGFQGIAFQFPIGSPIEEIRVDTAREGDNVVEVRLADSKGTVFRVRERECQKMDGTIDRTNLEINGRPQYRLKGNTHFSCPKQGLQGDAEYDGCLPQ